ncbi:MAG: sigma-54 dependent transcriptional regulator [Planctomycetota bacterium]
MTERQILVVDDEPSICWAFEKMLTSEGHRVITASSAEDALDETRSHSFDLVVLDVRLPRRDGISALPDILSATNDAPVIIITAFGDLETAVAAVKQGASDYLTKPIALDDALNACRRALQHSKRKTQSSAKPSSSTGESVLVGQSSAMQRVFRQIALVAESDLSVLITGETGTGKELVAAAIHRHSGRSAAPYLPIAPVALNEELIESELFGHVKGAFTGAQEDRQGLFERAEGGTILLDEIGDLPLSIQVKLLRVLEQQEFTRVGDVRPRKSDVRILAATNCDLNEAVERGTFREDLFHRLSGMQIHLPPLRKRTEDIKSLCEHFLGGLENDILRKADRSGPMFDESLIEFLKSQPWHGNVREFRHAIEHAAIIARGRPLSISDFPPPKPRRGESASSPSDSLISGVEQWTLEQLSDNGDSVSSLHSKFLAASEPTLIRLALRHTSGNRAKAAELLGMHRGTLRERLRLYEMDE